MQTESQKAKYVAEHRARLRSAGLCVYGVMHGRAVNGSRLCAKCKSKRRKPSRVKALKHDAVRAAIHQEEPQKFSRACECGASKDIAAEACERCLHLDGGPIRAGSRATKTDVIAILRGTDGLSLGSMCRALGIDDSVNNGRRGIWRQVKALLDEGRVRRYWCEEQLDMYKEMFGRGEELATQTNGMWIYILDGATEREWESRARRAA